MHGPLNVKQYSAATVVEEQLTVFELLELQHTQSRTFVMYSGRNCCIRGAAIAQWLRCCAINRKVAGSIPAGVSGVFIDIKSFRSHYGPGVDSTSNRNEYQEYFLGVKAAGA